MKKRRSLWSYASLFVAVFALDRIVKAFMLRWGRSDVSITSFLSFRLSLNRGMSWGMFHSYKTGPFIAVSFMTLIIIIPLLFYAYVRLKKGFSIWGETLVIAGALSNFIDRILYGGVLDFIYFSYGDWSWPIFNLADTCIVFGVFLMILTFSREG